MASYNLVVKFKQTADAKPQNFRFRLDCTSAAVLVMNRRIFVEIRSEVKGIPTHFIRKIFRL